MKGAHNCLKCFIKRVHSQISQHVVILHIPTLLIHQLSCSVLPIAAYQLYRLYEKCIHGLNVTYVQYKKYTTVNLQ